MRKVVIPFVVFGLLTTGISRGQDQAKAVEAIEGTWQGVSAEIAGKTAGLQSVWEIKDGKVISTLRDRKTEWTYAIDPNKNPKEIDLNSRNIGALFVYSSPTSHQAPADFWDKPLIPGGGLGAVKTLKGIYKIEADTLSVCYIMPHVRDADKRPRPSDFGPNRNDVFVLTFQRRKL